VPKFLFSPFVPAPKPSPPKAEPLARSPRRTPVYEPFDFIGTLRTAEGATLRYGIARPVAGTRGSGSVLLLQGRAECLEKYREIVEGLTIRGLSVYSFDWHGQGLSDRLLRGRRRMEVRSFEDYLDDLDLFIREVWCRLGENRYIVAHSTGGHVALRYMAERGLRVAGAVLCAPMIDLQTHRWPRWFAPLLAAGAVGLGLGRCQIPGERLHLPSVRQFEGNHLTSDPERFRILPDLVRANPAFERRGATYRWVRAAFRSIAKLNRPSVAESIASPVTLLVGTDDTIIDAEAVRAFAARLPNGRIAVLEGARHEIMMENDAVLAEFWRAVGGMLDS
jgi:lysophospholipase